MKKQLEKERGKLLSSIEQFLEGPIIFLGFLWLVLLLVELVWGLLPFLYAISITIWIIFIIDFLVKIILAPNKAEFLRKNWLVMISLAIPALRVFRAFSFLRALRGLRGVRVIRIISSLNRGFKALAATMQLRALGYCC